MSPSRRQLAIEIVAAVALGILLWSGVHFFLPSNSLRIVDDQPSRAIALMGFGGLLFGLGFRRFVVPQFFGFVSMMLSALAFPKNDIVMPLPPDVPDSLLMVLILWPACCFTALFVFAIKKGFEAYHRTLIPENNVAPVRQARVEERRRDTIELATAAALGGLIWILCVVTRTNKETGIVGNSPVLPCVLFAIGGVIIGGLSRNTIQAMVAFMVGVSLTTLFVTDGQYHISVGILSAYIFPLYFSLPFLLGVPLGLAIKHFTHAVKQPMAKDAAK